MEKVSFVVLILDRFSWYWQRKTMEWAKNGNELKFLGKNTRENLAQIGKSQRKGFHIIE